MATANADPTRTLDLRNRFAGRAGRRFRNLRGLVRTTVMERDALSLRVQQGQPADDLRRADRPQTVDAFLSWFSRQANLETLGRDNRPEQPPRDLWMREHLREAYARGVRRAREQARQQDESILGETAAAAGVAALLALPVHAEALQLRGDRAYRDLAAILDAQDAEVSRVLADALAAGSTPEALVRRVNDRVRKIGETRARTLARTYVIRLHADAQLNELERLGFEEVMGDAELEFTTAGDAHVCPRCRALEGTRRRISEARGIIPVHPRCRCSWRPVLTG